MDGLIALQAIFTLGIAVVGVGFFYFRNLNEGNKDEAEGAIVDDHNSSKSTAVRGGGSPKHLR